MGKHIVAGKANPLRLIINDKTGYAAITTFWDTVYYSDKKYITTKRKAHEECHLMQMKKEGKFMFAVKYLYELIRHGYLLNKYEVEARATEEEA